MSYIKKYTWVIILLLLTSLIFNVYQWRETRKVQYFWASSNLPPLGGEINQANGFIQAILKDTSHREFREGVLLTDLLDASYRAQAMSSVFSPSWHPIYVALDQSATEVLHMYQNESMDDKQVRKLQDIKIFLDEFLKAYHNPNNNLNKGYIDENALHNVKIQAEELSKNLNS